MLEIHHDLFISYRKLSFIYYASAANSDPLAVMADRLIRINMHNCNIADVSSYIHILVYLGIVIMHMQSLSR